MILQIALFSMEKEVQKFFSEYLKRFVKIAFFLAYLRLWVGNIIMSNVNSEHL